MAWFKLMFIISFITLNGKAQYLRKQFDTRPFTCQIDDIDFWKFYNWHFGDATNINIRLLLRKNSYSIQQYLWTTLQYLFGQGQYKRSFEINSYNISSRTEQVEDDLVYSDMTFIVNLNDTVITDEVSVLHSYNEFNYLQKLLRNSGDPEYAFLVIAWDVEDLEDFMIEYSKEMLRTPRRSYMIVFVSPVAQTEEDLENVLRTMWEVYGILNTFVKMPCSPRYKEAFKYSPFELTHGKWGILQAFTVEEALLNPIQIRHNFRNLNGYPVPISMFIRRPSAVTDLPKTLILNRAYRNLDRSGGYAGVDGMVLATIADKLNFTSVIHTPATDREYGFEAPNGTMVGSLGDVVNRKVAASFNGRFLTVYESSVGCEFTAPVSNDFLCFMVPKAEKIPQWLKIFRCFTFNTWLSIFLFYIFVSIYWYVVKHVDVTGIRIQNEGQRVSDAFFEILTVFISVHHREVFWNSQRIFMACLLVFNIVFASCFQGFLYNSYSKTLFFQDIDTLEELDMSGIKIITASRGLLGGFESDMKPVIRSLKNKILLLNTSSTLKLAATSRNLASLERKNDALMRIKTEHTRKSDGMELLHVMRECPRTYYVAYIVPSGSPYLPVFDTLITAFREAGLIRKWSQDTVDAFILEKRVHPTESTDELKPFTLKDMQTAFLLLEIGFAVAIFAFLLEYSVFVINVFCKCANKNNG